MLQCLLLLLETLAQFRAALHVKPSRCRLFVHNAGFLIAEEYLDVSLIISNQYHIIESDFLFLLFGAVLAQTSK